MWTAVESRKHTVPKIFPFGNNADEFMLYGTVDLGLKNGGSASLEWAGRAKIVKSSGDGKWRMKFYQVYLVSRAVKIGLVGFELMMYNRTLEQQTLTRSES